MKRLSMKLALVVGLALAMGTVVELQHNTAHAQRGGGRGGGRSGGGGSGQVGGGSGGARGGGSGHVGGGGSRSGGGGVRPGISGFRGSAIHAPALRGPRNAGGGERVGGGGAVRNNGGRVVRNEGGGGGAVRNNGGGGAAIRGNSGDRVTRDSAGRVGAGGVGSPGRIYSPNRTPSLSHPNPGSIRSQITRNPIFNNRGNGPGRVDNSRGRVTGNNRINPGNFGVNGRNNARIGGTSQHNSSVRDCQPRLQRQLDQLAKQTIQSWQSILSTVVLSTFELLSRPLEWKPEPGIRLCTRLWTWIQPRQRLGGRKRRVWI
jgi:hypothetical protein